MTDLRTTSTVQLMTKKGGRGMENNIYSAIYILRIWLVTADFVDCKKMAHINGKIFCFAIRINATIRNAS